MSGVASLTVLASHFRMLFDRVRTNRVSNMNCRVRINLTTKQMEALEDIHWCDPEVIMLIIMLLAGFSLTGAIIWITW